MHTLSDKQLYDAIHYARNIDESEGKGIIQNFQKEQSALAHTLFNIFPAMIAQSNEEMAMMFMDLLFDVLCIYQFSFGKAPVQTEAWLNQQMAVVGAELKNLKPENKGSKTSVSEALKREIAQDKLIVVMYESIEDYANESSARQSSVKLTQASLLSVLKLLTGLYSSNTVH